MKPAQQVLCFAFAAAQISGGLWAAASEPTLENPSARPSRTGLTLTNPAYYFAESAAPAATLTNPSAEYAGPAPFQSIVPATCELVPANGCCDATCDSSVCCGDGACCGDGCGDCGCGCSDCGSGVFGFFGSGSGAPRWMASAGGVVLSRSQPVPAVIADPIAGATGLRSTDFSIGTTVGLDLSIARRFGEITSFEARYLGALEWDPRAEFTVPNDLNLGGINLGGLEAIGGGYNSTLHSSEFNIRRQSTERFSWLAGFRWIELQDTIDFFVRTNGVTQSLSWNTNNHLYGGQIGADYLFWESARRPLSIKGSAKGGIFGNVADHDFSQFVGGNEVLSGGGFGDEVAYLTELGAWASYRFSDHWSARLGGTFMYLDGVAIASDHIAASLVQGNPNVFDSSGYVYFMGGLASIDCVW